MSRNGVQEKNSIDEFKRMNLIERIINNITNNSYLGGRDGVDIREDFQMFNLIKYEKIMREKGVGWFSKHMCEMEDALFYDVMEELFRYVQKGESKVRVRAMRVFLSALTASRGLFLDDVRLEHAWKVEAAANKEKYWDFFVNAMSDEDENIRRETKKIVKRFRASVKIPRLYHLLKNENPYTRRGAREALLPMIHEGHYDELAYYGEGAPEWWVDARRGELFDYDEYLEHLLEAAGQEDDDIRKKIASELENLSKPLPSELFIEKLSSPNEWIREFSAKMLRHLYYSEKQEIKAVETLKETLRDPSPKVRKMAVETMGEYYWWPDEPHGNPFTETLVKALVDQDPSVREAALEALGKLSMEEHAIVEIVETLTNSLENEQKEGEKPLDTLLKMLNNENRYIRRLATLSLGKFRDPKVSETLKILLNDKHDAVREAATLVLDYLPDKLIKKKN